MLCASFCHSLEPDYVTSSPIPPDSARIEKARADIEAYLDYWRWKGKFYGMTVGVVQGEALVYSRGAGYTEGQRYALGSITKIFTATAIMRLIQQKQLYLDAPISVYLPELELEKPELHSRPITIRHLLSHTSGLPDLRYLHPTLKTIPGFPFPVPPQIVPAGLHYRYSNTGFMILGELVARRSEMKLGEFVKHEIFEPLEMDGTEAPQMAGASGINTNIEDLSHFAIMFLNHGRYHGKQILDSSSVDEMLTLPIYYPPAESQEYCGLGWRVKRGPDGVATFFHIGGADYIAGWIQLFPLHNVAVMYLGNPPKYDDEAMSMLIGLQWKLGNLAGAYAGASEPLTVFKATQPDRKILEEYEGTYRHLISGLKAKVYLQNKSLFFKREGSYPYEIAPQTNHVFVGGYESLTHDFVHEPGTNRLLGVATYDGFYAREEEQDVHK